MMKKIIRSGIITISYLFGMLTFHSVAAQDMGIYTKEASAGALSGSTVITLPLKSDIKNTFYVRTGNAKIRTDFGGAYTFGSSTGAMPFSLRIEFDLNRIATSGVSTLIGNYEMTIDNENPEALVYKNLKEFISLNGSGVAYPNSSGFTFDQLRVDNIIVTDMMVPPANSTPAAITTLTMYLSYEIEYALDVSGTSNITLASPVISASSKVVEFNWSQPAPAKEYPNYQFQIMRLFNANAATTADEKTITADLDWSQALTFETESSKTSLKLTIGEGQGYYVWRVRPIGTFYKGNIANSGNWGQWNITSPANSTGVAINSSTTGAHYFFFNDKDDDKNYIYSRTFSEKNKMRENITYATELQRAKQTQVYLPSKNTKLITQTVLDKSGRPALSTLPAPSSGEFSGYKENFVKTTNDNLYKSKDFDMDNYIDNPAQVKDDAGDFSYYSKNNPDKRIPDAEQYPFSRTIFENDGTGRVKEQSGVGKRHTLGKQSDEKGRTVRTLYGTPSNDELIAIFGDEAPLAENVQKIITIDQNNTASVTYTSKEGKVIATALTFMENDNTDVLDPLAGEPVNTITVTDKSTNNTLTSEGFVSAKRITLTEPTAIAINYKIKCFVLDNLCLDINIDCGYDLKIIIHNLDDPLADQILTGAPQLSTLKNSDCVDDEEGVGYKNVSFGTFNLSAGTYIIEKKLSQSGQVSVEVEESKEKIELQVKPISKWISNTLEQVNCEEELMLFYNDLFYFASLVNSGSLPSDIDFKDCIGCSETTYSFPPDFMDIYNADPGKYEISIFNNDGTVILSSSVTPSPLPNSDTPPAMVVINTPCCVFPLSVLYTPPFKCPPAADMTALKTDIANEIKDINTFTVNTDFLRSPQSTEYLPDFEGYAISMLRECNDVLSVSDAETLLYKHMQGWHVPGTFNKMAYHMLTDVYACNGLGRNESCINPTPGTAPAAINSYDECGEGSEDGVAGAQYKCADLSACWTNLVMQLLQSYCPNFQSFDINDFTSGGNISDGVDDQNEGDATVHDDHFDDGFDDVGWLVKWLAKRKMSKKMRELQNNGGAGLPPEKQPEYDDHLVFQFLNCTGYQFADIIEPEVREDNSVNSCYPVNSQETQAEASPYSGESCFIALDYDFDGNVKNGEYDPQGFFTNEFTSANPPATTSLEWSDLFINPAKPTKKIKHLFPNIKHPVYAFKYFEYEDGSNRQMELATCYADPNICYDAVAGVIQRDIDDCTPVKIACCGETAGVPDPCNYCGQGYITCPYTHENWNCGQRYTFYTMMKTQVETDADWEEQAPIDCAFLSASELWYTNPGDEIGLDYITATQLYTLYGTTADPDDAIEFEHLNGAINNTTPISSIEIKAVKMQNQCKTNCDNRRAEFRVGVIKMFTDRCYVIGGCKVSADDNIIPEEDVEAIVDKIVAQCKIQCPITTYTCEDEACRLSNTPVTDLGDDQYGNNNIITNLQMGVGGHLTDINDCPAGGVILSDCNSFLPSNKAALTYSELTKWLQATQWDFDLDIISKCNDQGVYDPAYTGVLYYYDVNGILTPQTGFDYGANCDGNTDTFVGRSDYLIDANTPPDGNSATLGAPVLSPQIEIEVIKP